MAGEFERLRKGMRRKLSCFDIFMNFMCFMVIIRGGYVQGSTRQSVDFVAVDAALQEFVEIVP